MAAGGEKEKKDSCALCRSGDAIRVSAKDGESYAEILKAMKEKVNPQNAGHTRKAYVYQNADECR